MRVGLRQVLETGSNFKIYEYHVLAAILLLVKNEQKNVSSSDIFAINRKINICKAQKLCNSERIWFRWKTSSCIFNLHARRKKRTTCIVSHSHTYMFIPHSSVAFMNAGTLLINVVSGSRQRQGHLLSTRKNQTLRSLHALQKRRGLHASITLNTSPQFALLHQGTRRRHKKYVLTHSLPPRAFLVCK